MSERNARPENRALNELVEENEHTQKFRFKEKSGPSRTDHERSRSSKRSHRNHHSSHHRTKRRRVSPSAAVDPSACDVSASGLPPDVAFRESLFDALGDDEGAAFWQGVYGEPIHNYPNTYQDEETGELERMNDDEYAQFVRRKMWEKSREGIEVAKEEKRRQREQEKQKIQEDEKRTKTSSISKDGFVFELEVEKSLRRGEQRKERKRWRGLWEHYLRLWADLEALAKVRQTATTEEEQVFLRNKIAWPTESGKRKDVNAEEIERFILKTAQGSSESGVENETLLAVLKAERVRWHPDKIQQRYGFMDIEDGTMQGVTAVFQVFDQMWNERRGKR